LRDKPDYTVRVQGKEVEVFSLPVNLIKARDGRDLPANFATCDMAGTVTVEVTVNFLDAAKIGGVSVHPLSRGIKAQREGARITFQVDRPGSLTLLVNGDHGLQPLHLFLCPPVEPPPPGAMVFGPGRHVVGGEDKPIRLKSGQTLYLAPGAWVVGNVRVDNATNICIMGRGVLTPMSRPFTPGQWASGPTAIFLNECQDVRIEGIVVTRPSLDWNITLMHCDTVTLRDVHVISPVAWSTDGCNPYNTRNVTIERCFFRDNDDCISPKGDFTMNPKNLQLALENITIRDSVFWCGQGGLFSIGPESVTKHIRNIKMQNCDVLYHSGGNTFQIVPVYGVEVRDVLYEDIRLETAVSSALFFFGPGGMCGDKSAEPPSIRGVTIRNVTFLDANAKRNSVMEGWGPDHLIQDVTIENLRYGDELILDAKAMGLKTNAWVKNLRFIGPAGKK
ncbi:MAG: glycosyl hydrolase family 28 protein, partial [Kiritimatiellia bacterium]